MHVYQDFSGCFEPFLWFGHSDKQKQNIRLLTTERAQITVMILHFRTDRPGQTVQILDQGLHCLQFPLHHLDALFYGEATMLKFELPHDKTNKMASAPSEDANQLGHPPSLISLHCPHEESLGPWLPTECKQRL